MQATFDTDEFIGFPKIHRLSREIIVTEKIDGTNGVVYVREDGSIIAGSRTRWLKPTKQEDNHGFAAWVKAHKESFCSVVPILYRGSFDTACIEAQLTILKSNGSFAAPGFMKPEGIVVFHTHGNFCLKKTFEKDDEGKGQ